VKLLDKLIVSTRKSCPSQTIENDVCLLSLTGAKRFEMVNLELDFLEIESGFLEQENVPPCFHIPYSIILLFERVDDGRLIEPFHHLFKRRGREVTLQLGIVSIVPGVVLVGVRERIVLVDRVNDFFVDR